MADRNKNPLRVDRYEDLTNPELVAIIEGERLDMGGQRNEAKRLMMSGLDLEHFIATLDLDPTKLTPDQRDELVDLQNQFTAISGQFVPLNILGQTGGRQLVENLAAIRAAEKAAGAMKGS